MLHTQTNTLKSHIFFWCYVWKMMVYMLLCMYMFGAANKCISLSRLYFVAKYYSVCVKIYISGFRFIFINFFLITTYIGHLCVCMCVCVWSRISNHQADKENINQIHLFSFQNNSNQRWFVALFFFCWYKINPFDHHFNFQLVSVGHYTFFVFWP